MSNAPISTSPSLLQLKNEMATIGRGQLPLHIFFFFTNGHYILVRGWLIHSYGCVLKFWVISGKEILDLWYFKHMTDLFFVDV